MSQCFDRFLTDLISYTSYRSYIENRGISSLIGTVISLFETNTNIMRYLGSPVSSLSALSSLSCHVFVVPHVKLFIITEPGRPDPGVQSPLS